MPHTNTDKNNTENSSKHASTDESASTPAITADVPPSFFKLIGEFIGVFVFSLFIAYLLRSFLYQPFHIPSASMVPNLYKGDYIIVNKFAYGYGKYSFSPLPLSPKKRWFAKPPKRGDVMVFKPEGQTKHYIKRLIGLPGDTVSIQDGHPFINGKALPYKIANFTNHLQTKWPEGAQIYQETAQSSASETQKNANTYPILDQGVSNADNMGPFGVPANYYFFLGDNRDNSLDSRFAVFQGGVSYVPASHLVGRAEFIVFSAKEGTKIYKPWTWIRMRPSRFFKKID